jgi:hypothetical protein
MIRFKDIVQFQVSKVSIDFMLNSVFEDKFKLMFLKVYFSSLRLKDKYYIWGFILSYKDKVCG